MINSIILYPAIMLVLRQLLLFFLKIPYFLFIDKTTTDDKSPNIVITANNSIIVKPNYLFFSYYSPLKYNIILLKKKAHSISII